MENQSENYDSLYHGKENLATAKKLQEGETCVVLGVGNSMTPILKSKQTCLVEPITEETQLEKDDIVFVKVNGHFYLHKIWSVKNGVSYLIGNNHGHANGTVSINNIYGKVIKIL